MNTSVAPQPFTATSSYVHGHGEWTLCDSRYDLGIHGTSSNFCHQALQPLPPDFDVFKGFIAPDANGVTDGFLFGVDDDEELKALMTAPILEDTFVGQVPSVEINSDFFPGAEEPIHSISPAPSQESTHKRRHGGCQRQDSPKRFRSYQSGNWSQRFQELCEYREKHGNCLISHTYAKNLPLARWVKRQRYQYKLMISGQPSTMIPERVRALENIGFCWGSQESAWNERFDELKEFKDLLGHCNVPSLYAENPQLATWVKCQRRQYKLFKNEDAPSNITLQRILRLEQIGFEWELKSSKKSILRRSY